MIASAQTPDAGAPLGIRIHEEHDDTTEEPGGGGDASPAAAEPEPAAQPSSFPSNDGGTHSARTPNTSSSTADGDAHKPAPQKNLRASHVRDSLDISSHDAAQAAAAYIVRKCLGDKTELGRSNATERTVDTVDTVESVESGTSDDNDADAEDDCNEDEGSKPPTTSSSSSSPAPPRYGQPNDRPMHESTTDMLQRQPTKSAMVHKTLESSLSTTYESTRRKMVRERKLEAKRARKLARARSKRRNGSNRRIRLKKAVSRMTLASRRNLFEGNNDIGSAESANGDSSKRLSEPSPNLAAGGPPSPGRRPSLASERSGLSRSKSSVDLQLSSSEHRAYEEEHNDRVPDMPKMDRRASLGSFKSTGSDHQPTNEDTGNIVGDDTNTNSSPSNRPTAAAGSFQNKSMRSMRSMRNLFSTSKTKLLLGGSLSSLFSHGSKSECFTVDDEDGEPTDGAELFPTLLTFDTVQIREYDPEVDANPCTSRGPALTLGWNYTTAPPVDFHQYEQYRPARRQMKEMRLPREVREQRLMASGVSRSEMERSIKQANIAKQRRSKTLRQLRHYTLHERLEGMKKKCLKLMGRRKSHEEEERKLWEEAQYYFGP